MPKTFIEKVYAALRRVPKGRVTTYKELAKTVGSRACRAIGSAMRTNKDIVGIPCYRVVRSDGLVGNYSGSGGTMRKIALLRSDGIEIKNGKIDLRRYLHRFR